jgi:hypothetical protein
VAVIMLCLAAVPAQAESAVPAYDQLVEQRIQEGIKRVAEQPWPFRGEHWVLADAFERQLAGITGNTDELNQAVLAYCAAFSTKAEKEPTPYSDMSISSLVFQLYLKPKYQAFLRPEAKAAIEKICWNWVYRHSYLKSPLDAKGRPWAYNNPKESVWYITGSENHDSRQRASNILGLQVLMAAGEPYGPGAKLYDGHTVADHYDAWVKWYIEFFRQRAREGLNCEIAHPSSYGAGTIGDYYTVEDCTDDPDLKRAASNFLTLFWADVAVEFETRTGIRAGLTSTRNYKFDANQTGRIYWARGLLRAYGWTDAEEAKEHLGSVHFLASDYRPPEILRAIARDPERGAYQVTSRRFGRTNGRWHYGVYRIQFDDGDAMNSYMRRDTWYTPDYALSTLSFDLNREYCALVSQSRMMGVTFSHDVDDRLVIYAGNTPADGKVEYKMPTMSGVNGLLGADCLIVARDPNAATNTSNSTRLFVSDGALWDNRKDDQGGWSFTRAGDGYAAFRIAGDRGYTIAQSPWKFGWYLEFNDIWAPMVVQTGQARNFKSFEAFQEAVKARPFQYDSGRLTYTALDGTRYEYWSNSTKIPTINGKPQDLNPPLAYDSPYLKMTHGTDRAVVCYPGYKELVLDFEKHN